MIVPNDFCAVALKFITGVQRCKRSVVTMPLCTSRAPGRKTRVTCIYPHPSRALCFFSDDLVYQAAQLPNERFHTAILHNELSFVPLKPLSTSGYHGQLSRYFWKCMVFHTMYSMVLRERVRSDNTDILLQCNVKCTRWVWKKISKVLTILIFCTSLIVIGGRWAGLVR